MPLVDVAFALDNVLLALSLAAAIIHGTEVRAPPSYPRLASKTASTALLSAVSSVRGSSSLLTTALALGATGDAFLAWNDSDATFLGGLSSFLVAHVLYIALLIQAGGGQVQLLDDGWRIATAGVLGVVLAPVMIALLMPQVERALRAPILVYTTAIILMVLAALTMDDGQVVAGALLFAASDGILSADRFLISPTSSHRAWMQYAVWGLYYSGQLLITLGLSKPLPS
jgi:uncharacterized membrane protein YhhN